MTQVRVLYHGNCFDGCVSAALFSAFYRSCVSPDVLFEYQGLTHGPRGPLDSSIFGPGENVIVDFRYAEDESLTWWFDHHRSAFYSEEARAHFQTRDSRQFIFDDAAPSCAGLLARKLEAEFGFDTEPFTDLIAWAEQIDSASFIDAENAVILPQPALKMMLLLEGNGDADLEESIIGWLQKEPIDAVMKRERVQAALAPLWENHMQAIEWIRKRASCEGDVVSFDLSDTGLTTYNKFIPYYLYEDALYAVGLLSTPKRVKVGVGSSPWQQHRRTHDIASLCEGYGGGGHPAVGAVSLAVGDVAGGREVQQAIIETLSKPGSA